MTTVTTPPAVSQSTAGRPGACAECRRLKHKCDRKVPCGRCVRKCCANICPNGTLSKEEGQGRFWPRMHEYQTSLMDLANRICQLEDALRVSHGRYSREPHPLLDEDRLRIKEPFLRQTRRGPDPPASGTSDGTGLDELTVSLDTLSVSELGRSRYIGPAAWTNLLKSESSLTAKHQAVLAALPPEISFIASCFTHSLLAGTGDELRGRLATLRCFLPTPEEVVRLKAIFYRTCTYAHDPVPEETFDVVFDAVYETPWNTSGWDEARVLHVHAVMFMVLALASEYDATLPALTANAAAYYELACASLVGTKICAAPTLESIQAMCLMNMYLSSNSEGVGSIRWTLLGTIIKSCQNMGLHRDPGQFNFAAVEANRRRKLFWTVYQLDVFAATVMSLPLSFTSDSFDTQLPSISDPTPDVYDKLVLWRYSFTRDCMQPIQRELFSNSQIAPYDRVLANDAKIRTYGLPEFLQSDTPISDSHHAQWDKIIFQRAFIPILYNSALLRLHRAHLFRATREHPENASKSPFAESVMASYRSASAILAMWHSSYEALNSSGSRIPNFFKIVVFAVNILVMIKKHCPALANGADAQLQCVPGADACWQLGGDIEDFGGEITRALDASKSRLSPSGGT